MSRRPVDLLVLGAGVLGAALAYHLAQRSVGSVAVYDPRPAGAGASGRAAGIVSLQLWSRWDVDVVRASADAYARRAGRDPTIGFRRNGFVRIASSPDSEAALAPAYERWTEWGVRCRRVAPADLGSVAPSVRPDGVRLAIYSPDDAVVTPSALVDSYLAEAERLGVELLVGRPGEIARSAERFELVRSGEEPRRARAVAVAAGAWSKRLLATLGAPLPLAPYRTQAALLSPRPPVPEATASIHDLDQDVYARPEAAGRLLAGDGTDRVECDPDGVAPGSDPEFLAHLARSFGERCPPWASAELVRSWAGVCTATPDRRPIVGEVVPGLYVLTGFNGFGVMRADGAAARLVDVIAANGRPSSSEEAALAPVAPGRFPPSFPPFAPKPGFTVEPGDVARF